MPRGSAHLLVILLLAVVFIWGFVVSIIKDEFLDFREPPSPTNFSIIDKYHGWKTYENEKHKFTLKYPTHWYVREFGNLDANFQKTDPSIGETTPAAIKVRFIASSTSYDQKEFENVNKAKEGAKIREPLDVISEITKVSSFEIGNNKVLEYTTDRTFTAPQGPPKEYRHTYAIARDGTILKFIATANTKEELQNYEKLRQLLIESLKFQESTADSFLSKRFQRSPPVY